MRCALRIINQLTIISLLVGAAAGFVAAQSREQDRRIEENKRDDLKVTTPSVTTTLSNVPALSNRTPPRPDPDALKPLYFASLIGKRVIYRYDAIKGVLIVLGLDDKYISLDSQVAFMQKEGLLPPRYRESFDPTQPLRRGLTAYMFQRALKIRGGIMLSLTGSTERYAMKELGFRGIISPGLVNDLFSGQELIQTITQSADYHAKHLAKQKQ